MCQRLRPGGRLDVCVALHLRRRRGSRRRLCLQPLDVGAPLEGRCQRQPLDDALQSGLRVLRRVTCWQVMTPAGELDAAVGFLPAHMPVMLGMALSANVRYHQLLSRP